MPKETDRKQELKELAERLGKGGSRGAEPTREEVRWARMMILRNARLGRAKEAEEIARSVPSAILEDAPRDEGGIHPIPYAARMKSKETFAALSEALCDLSGKDAGEMLLNGLQANYFGFKETRVHRVGEMKRDAERLPAPILAAFVEDDPQALLALLESEKIGPALLAWGKKTKYAGESVLYWSIACAAARCSRLLAEIPEFSEKEIQGKFSDEIDPTRMPQRVFQESYEGVGLSFFDKTCQQAMGSMEAMEEWSSKEKAEESLKVWLELAERIVELTKPSEDRNQKGTGMRMPDMACAYLAPQAASKLLAKMDERGFSIDWGSCADAMASMGSRRSGWSEKGEVEALVEWARLRGESEKARKESGAREPKKGKKSQIL